MFPSFPIPFLRLPVGCIQQKRTPWPIPWRSFASDFVSHGFQTQLRWCLNRELSDSGIAWNSYGFNSWRSTKPSRNQATNELGTGMINGSRELNVGQTQIWIDMGHMDQNFTPAIPFFQVKNDLYWSMGKCSCQMLPSTHDFQLWKTSERPENRSSGVFQRGEAMEPSKIATWWDDQIDLGEASKSHLVSSI